MLGASAQLVAHLEEVGLLGWCQGGKFGTKATQGDANYVCQCERHRADLDMCQKSLNGISFQLLTSARKMR